MSTPPSLSRNASRHNLEADIKPVTTEGAPASPAEATPARRSQLGMPSFGGRPVNTGEIARGWTACKLNHPKTVEVARSEPLLSPRTHRRDASLLAAPVKTDAGSAPTPGDGASESSSTGLSSAASATTTTTTTTSSTTTGTTATRASATLATVNATSTTSTASTTGKPAASASGTRSIAGSELPAELVAILEQGLGSRGSLPPDQLGKLLVAVGSQCGQARMGEAQTDAILRGGLKIDGYQPSGGTPTTVNVIEQMCVPFMREHLATPAFEKVLDQIVREFDQVADEVNPLCQNKRPGQFLKDPRVAELMGPVVAPFVDTFCGKQRSFASSGMPAPLKQLLVSIDKEIIRWFEQAGSGKPGDLYQARRNALVNFLSTRSIMPIWNEQINTRFAHPERYQKMSAFLNSYIAHAIDDFIKDVLIAQPDQSIEQRGYIETLAGRRTLRTKGSMRQLDMPASSLILDKGKSLTSMGGGTPSLALSPRTRGSSTDKVRDAEKLSKKKAMERKAERAQLIDQIALKSAIDRIDHAFFLHLKESIVNGSARGFDNFKRDPISSCIQRAKDWYALPVNAKIAKTSTPATVVGNLDVIREAFPVDMATTFKRMQLDLPSNPFDADSSSDDKEDDLQASQSVISGTAPSTTMPATTATNSAGLNTNPTTKTTTTTTTTTTSSARDSQSPGSQ